MEKLEIVNAITEQGLLPLYYQDDTLGSIEIMKTLYKAGIRVFEYTNRGEAALGNFDAMRRVRDAEMTDLYLGIGTIKNEEEAKKFVDAGTDFIIAPTVNEKVAEVANKLNMLWIPGCMTPTEISVAQSLHAAIIKIFPANILGPAFISAVREIFPKQLFIPTGGVEINSENMNSWFKAGVCAVGLGSKLISKELMKEKLYDDLFYKTELAITIIKNLP